MAEEIKPTILFLFRGLQPAEGPTPPGIKYLPTPFNIRRLCPQSVRNRKQDSDNNRSRKW